MTRSRLLVVTALALAGCRGDDPVRSRSPGDAALAALVDSLRPAVEREVGRPFLRPPRSAMRSRAQVHDYLVRKLHEDMPPARLTGVESAYRLFGMLPDSVGLKSVLLELYTEQVAGYYDPDSTMLFGVKGVDPLQLKLVLAHEMVHALQGQYLPLDSILRDLRSNDRLAAAQAVLEGQATLASIQLMAPDQSVTASPEFWEQYRAQVSAQQSAMPVFARAPLVLRRTLLFPYLDGAEFVRWWNGTHSDSMPWGSRMPVSTEQVLHPDRYERGDRPFAVEFTSGPEPAYEDQLGELEARVLEAEFTGGSAESEVPFGWGGDHYRVYRTPAGAALVWYAVFDDGRSAERFARRVSAPFTARARPGYRAAVDRVQVGDLPGVRLVSAPTTWPEWSSVPAATASR
jgi:hypothetical protein